MHQMRIPPELIDSHHHLWRRADAPFAGILGAPYLNRDFSFPDLEAAAEGLFLAGTVFVQVRDDLEEVDYVESVARDHPTLGAMIAFAPLESPDVGGWLDRLGERPLVRGVRRNTQMEPDPAFVLQPGFVDGGRRLGERGLLCELCVRHEQIASVPAFARECPETRIVLEHLGKPDVTGPPPPAWLRAVEELAGLPNAVCKVSVVVHSADDPTLRADVMAPFVRHAVDCFGWDRVLFGSNWPVSTAVAGYRAWAEMVTEILSGAGATPAQLAGLFAGNARRLYGLS
jgi:L-fuconolactonase